MSTPKETDSGHIMLDGKMYIVTHVHDHKTLHVGDRVRLAYTPDNNEGVLVRACDFSIHARRDEYLQFVHLLAEDTP